jgi:hypothetical protein
MIPFGIFRSNDPTTSIPYKFWPTKKANMPKLSRSSDHVSSNDIKYGLKIASRCPSTSKVNGLECRFCISFGREAKLGAKRNVSSTVGSWTNPFRYDNIEGHLLSQHPAAFDEYSQLSKDDKHLFFDKNGGVPFLNSLKSHFPSEALGQHPLLFDINVGIVDNIIGGMIYAELEDAVTDNHSDDDNDDDEDSEDDHTFAGTKERTAQIASRVARQRLAKTKAMSVFVKAASIVGSTRQQQHYTVTIPKTKTQQFQLSIRHVAAGASFRLASQIIENTCQVCALPALRSCTRQHISNYIRAVSAINLQRLSELLQQSWAFSIALDSATHFGMSYLDIRFRLYVKGEKSVVNLHGCALPMTERHTGKVISQMVCRFLDEICPKWRVSLLAATSDGAANMTGRFSGALTLLQNELHVDCQLIRIWCGAHQLDLVMGQIYQDTVNEHFYTIWLNFISHLTRQQSLISTMGTTCPRVVNRWLSTDKVTSWFKAHRLELVAYTETKDLSCFPCKSWWVYLLALDAFSSLTASAFRKIQGLTTLVSQQQNALYELMDALMETSGVSGPLSTEAQGLLDIEIAKQQEGDENGEIDANTTTRTGAFHFDLATIKEFVCGLASWVEDILEGLTLLEEGQLLQGVGDVFCNAINGVNSIVVARDRENGPSGDSLSRLVPPVLPHELVKISAADFLRRARHQATRLNGHFGSNAKIDVIADEHKALIMAHRREEVLRTCIDSGDNSTSFETGWGTLSSRFPNLAEFCGGVATIFPGSSTVESDFSVLRMEKDAHRKKISDFGLEGVLQSKQFKRIEKLVS